MVDDVRTMQEVISDTKIACGLFAEGMSQAAGALLRKAFKSVETLVTMSYHDVISEVFTFLVWLKYQGFSDLAQIFTRYLAAISAKVLPSGHPRRHILAAIRDLDPEIVDGLQPSLRRCMSAYYQKHLSKEHVAVIELSLDGTRDSGDTEYQISDLGDAERILNDMDCRFGPFSRRAIMTMNRFCKQLLQVGEYIDAEVLIQRLIKRILVADLEYRLNFFPGCWSILGDAQILQGKRYEAATSFTHALAAAEVLGGWRVWDVMHKLEKVLHEIGDCSRVRSLRKRRNDMLSEIVNNDMKEHLDLPRGSKVDYRM